jgi:hypothetical protein
MTVPLTAARRLLTAERRGAARCRGPGGPSAVPSTTAILATQEGCGRVTEVQVHATN